MNQMPPQENNDGIKILALVIFTTLFTCGLMLPVWLIIGAIILIIQILNPKPKPKPPVNIPISNEFVSDWTFEIKGRM